MSDDDLASRLAALAEHEARVRPGPLTRLMRRAGRTRFFSGAYRRVGLRLDVALLHVREGRFTAAVYGLPILQLHTVGARSGESRLSVLLYVRDGVDLVVIGTNFGQPRHPGWTANLLAHPGAHVQVGPVRLDVEARLLDSEAWARLFPSFVTIYPGYADYLDRREGLTPRMFRLTPVG
jgi:deazaflavin-dependent oxidoreductase (nitroreductase family)